MVVAPAKTRTIALAVTLRNTLKARGPIRVSKISEPIGAGRPPSCSILSEPDLATMRSRKPHSPNWLTASAAFDRRRYCATARLQNRPSLRLATELNNSPAFFPKRPSQAFDEPAVSVVQGPPREKTDAKAAFDLGLHLDKSDFFRRLLLATKNVDPCGALGVRCGSCGKVLIGGVVKSTDSFITGITDDGDRGCRAIAGSRARKVL